MILKFKLHALLTKLGHISIDIKTEHERMSKILTTNSDFQNSTLYAKSSNVDIPIDSNTKYTIETLVSTFKNIGGGRGLAAPQIGFNQRIILCCYSKNANDIEILINPRYKPNRSKLEEGWEGCFSVPNTLALVTRWNSIIASYYDLHGKEINIELNGIKARVFQHEYDHLEGKLIIDNATDIKIFEYKADYIHSLRVLCDTI